MPMNAEAFHPVTEDPVSNVLKWILLAVAILTFGLMGWPPRGKELKGAAEAWLRGFVWMIQ